MQLNKQTKKNTISYLDEKKRCITLAARYTDACHKKRESTTNQ